MEADRFPHRPAGCFGIAATALYLRLEPSALKPFQALLCGESCLLVLSGLLVSSLR